MNNVASLRTVVRRIAATAALAGIGATAGIASTATPANAAYSGCELDCVNAVNVVQILGDKASFIANFTTTVPANITIKISEINGTVVGTVASIPGTYWTSHSLGTAKVMNQGQGYVASIIAIDKNGKRFTQQMSVTALQRTVKVVFGTLKVTEDSDVGAGEIRAGVKLGNSTMTLFGQKSISAIYTQKLGTVWTATKVPETAKLQVELQDNDIDPGEFCSSGSQFSFTSGSNSCYDWTTGRIGMGSVPQEKGHSITRTVTALADGKVDFTVGATLTITVS